MRNYLLNFLFTKFPNLAGINLQNNPSQAINLNNLTPQQFNKLVQGIKTKKIRVDSFKGTILMDLLEYAQKLSKQGNNQQQNARYLQTLLSSPVKNDHQKPENNSLLIGGLIIAGALILGIGYRLGKRRKNSFEYE